MGVDLGTGPGATACPVCGAALRPGAPWCTLCFADLRPAPAAPAEPTLDDAVVGEPVAGGPAAADVPSWPCSRCAVANPLERDTCGACGASFLAVVRDAEAPLLVLPGIGDLGRLGRAQRLLLALGVVLAVLVPLAVVTLLLTQRPPAAVPPAAPCRPARCRPRPLRADLPAPLGSAGCGSTW